MVCALNIAVALGLFATVCEALSCLHYNCWSCTNESTCAYSENDGCESDSAVACVELRLSYVGSCWQVTAGCVPSNFTNFTCDAYTESIQASIDSVIGYPTEIDCSSCDTDFCNEFGFSTSDAEESTTEAASTSSDPQDTTTEGTSGAEDGSSTSDLEDTTTEATSGAGVTSTRATSEAVLALLAALRLF